MKNTVINGIEMDCLAMEYKAIQSQIDELSVLLEAKKDEIKSKLAEMEDYRTETFHFIYKPVISERFDTVKFKKENPVIAQQYMKTSTARPLKIT